MRLIVLRPEPGASATVARARALGLAAEAHPLFAVRPLDWSLPDGAFDALLATSANMFRHGGAQLAGLTALPVYAVGAATAAAARAAGFARVIVGGGDAAAILAQAAADGHAHLLHLVGREHRAVEQAGVRIVRVAVYASDDTGVPVPGEGVALVHSPRAGQVLAARAMDRGRLRIAAISPAAAAAAGPGWAALRIAAAPDDDALLAAAASLCEEGQGERA